MRGGEVRSGSLFSYVDLPARVPRSHPLRTIRALVDAALVRLDGDFAAIYAPIGRPSIPPEQLLRALLLQAFYSVRSERQLMEQLDYNLLFRWFVGLGIDSEHQQPQQRPNQGGGEPLPLVQEPQHFADDDRLQTEEVTSTRHDDNAMLSLGRSAITRPKVSPMLAQPAAALTSPTLPAARMWPR